jgi:hypothetical protein
MHRGEAGYRYRLWAWKQKHVVAYHIATNVGPFLGAAAYFPLERLAGSPHPTVWFVLMLPLLPLGWLFNGPREPRWPAEPSS